MTGAVAPPETYAYPDRVAWATEPIWKLTVEQYHAMIRHGILESGTPVELLAGLMVPKMRKVPPHTYATRLLRKALEKLIPPDWFVDSQGPTSLSESEPEPDLMVVRGTIEDYATRHPGPLELGLVIEVAESSLNRDRNLKQPLYSQDAIAEYWILDLVHRKLEVFTAPQPGTTSGYAHNKTYGESDHVPVILDGVVIGHILVSDVLPS